MRAILRGSVGIESEEYAERRERLSAALEEHVLEAHLVPPSSDLEYLTWLERDLHRQVCVEDVIAVTETRGRML